ncbi:hypothetical protein C0992_002818 [Termitomyces sp. T32_za158]|nr:hypothetical protein C0992_002818 [Termitomyces sp. T32_za158]
MEPLWKKRSLSFARYSALPHLVYSCRTNVMPAFRNVESRRSSGRMWSKSTIEYHGTSLFTSHYHQTANRHIENGWEIPSQTDVSLSIPIHHDMPSPHSSATSPSIASVDSDFEFHPARKFKGKAKVTHLSDSDYVPRPKNAFILFRSYFYQTCGGSDQNQISVNAGKAWKALPDEQKKPFQLAADREKQEHQAKFPHYTYAPGSRLGNIRRKKNSAMKNRTQPSANESRVHPPAPHRDSRTSQMKAEPAPVTILPPAMFSLAPPSPIVSTNGEEPTIDLVDSDAALQWEPVSTNCAFETAFVPTSEIPPLELPPVKSDKVHILVRSPGDQSDLVFQKWNKDMKGLKPSSSLRPPNFDTSHEPFCFNPQPVSIGSYLDISISNFGYDNETLEQLLNSSNSCALTPSPSGFETWNVNDAKHSGPLELSYVGYGCPTKPEVNWEVDMIEDLAIGNDFEFSLFPSLAAGPFKAYASFDDCEMDAFVDYGECDV